MFKLSTILSLFLMISCAENSSSSNISPVLLRSDSVAKKLVFLELKTDDGVFILYTDNTWTQDLSKSVVIKSKKKINKKNNVVINNYQVSISPPDNNYKPKKSYSTNNYNGSYSSTCGATTKKGGACRRVVKGGGRCWQH